MAEIRNTKGILYQNLLDAGCNEKEVEQCMLCAEKGAQQKLCSLLEKHRQGLNNKIHKNQEMIDCVDFLLHKVRKES